MDSISGFDFEIFQTAGGIKVHAPLTGNLFCWVLSLESTVQLCLLCCFSLTQHDCPRPTFPSVCSEPNHFSARECLVLKGMVLI